MDNAKVELSENAWPKLKWIKGAAQCPAADLSIDGRALPAQGVLMIRDSAVRHKLLRKLWRISVVSPYLGAGVD
jgi:hypothetical protein